MAAYEVLLSEFLCAQSLVEQIFPTDVGHWSRECIILIFILRRREIKKTLRKFGHMSKLGVPFLPCSLVWTNISLDKPSSETESRLSLGMTSNKTYHFQPAIIDL